VGNWDVYEQVRKVFLRLKADPFRCRSTTTFPPPFPPSPAPSSRFFLILGDGERRPIKLVKLEVLRLTASDIVLLFEDHRLKASNRAASASPVTPSFESKERSALMRRDDEAADLLGSKEKGVASNASFEEVRAKRFNNRFLNFMRLGSIIDDAAESFFKSEIRRRLFVTAVLIIVSRLGYFIPLPGFDRRLIPDTYLSFAAGSTDELGDFTSELKLSLFQLGLGPQISASILMQIISTRTVRYWAVPSKIDRRRPIEGEIDRRRSIEEEKGKMKKKRKKRKKEKKKKRRRRAYFPRDVLARAPSSPAGNPRALFLPHKETERLPVRGERSRRRTGTIPVSR
ncbi:hypothetical protein BHE74_00050596, partial [Ensete ventricosum]